MCQKNKIKIQNSMTRKAGGLHNHIRKIDSGSLADNADFPRHHSGVHYLFSGPSLGYKFPANTRPMRPHQLTHSPCPPLRLAPSLPPPQALKHAPRRFMHQSVVVSAQSCTPYFSISSVVCHLSANFLLSGQIRCAGHILLGFSLYDRS